MEITKTIAPADIYYRRGDIRFFLLQYTKSRECNTLGWLILHSPKQEIGPLLERYAQTTYIAELINQCLFIFQSFDCIEPADIIQLLRFADASLLAIRPLKETLQELTTWVLHLRGKFETFFP